MQYLLLIYENEAAAANATQEQMGDVIRAYQAFTESIKASGHFIAGDALESVKTATTVRIRDGKAMMTDGPFAETKEQLGGYYLVDAKDLDEALAIAQRIPAAKSGCVEVRPLMQFG
jgi:hypothetical protein